MKKKLLISISAFFLLICIFITIFFQSIAEKQAIQTAINEAKSIAATINLVRKYYTENVVNIVAPLKIKAIHNFSDSSNSIPLPATMTHDLNTLLSSTEGFRINLFSKYPFPFRENGGIQDAYQEKAYNYLEINKLDSYWEVEEKNDITFVRYSIGDLLTSETCVNCHNTHPESPKTNWKLNDLRGILEVSIPISDNLEAMNRGTIYTVIFITFCLIIILIISEILISKIVKSKEDLEEKIEKINITEAENRKYYISLSDKNAELEQLVYISSHDLRSPLVNIGGFGKEIVSTLEEIDIIVKKSSMPETERKEIVDLINSDILDSFTFINTSIKKMDVLLNGLTAFSRIGRYELILEEIDSNGLFNEIFESFEFLIKDHNFTVEINHLENCYGDYNKLNQLFSNLISNSLRYKDPNKNGLIQINSYANDNEIVFIIKDNGIGINEKNYDDIFKIFRRLNPKDSDGEGLGLAFVKKIVAKHNGSIRLESKENIGTTFYVSLPNNSEL